MSTRKKRKRKNTAKKRVAAALCVLLAVSFAFCFALVFWRRAEAAPVQTSDSNVIETASAAPSVRFETNDEPKQSAPPAIEDRRKTDAQQSAVRASLAAPQAAAQQPKPPQSSNAKLSPRPVEPPAPKLPDTTGALPAAQNGATLIFVFDDAGQNLSHLAPFLELPFKHTVAVLPRLPYSAESAKRIRAAGKEVILHQPMQAQNRAINPGPGAITPGMEAHEIKTIVEKNIAEIAPIAGMNNHEGSLITESAEAVGAVLDVCREKRIYFLDSRTTSATAVPAAAKERGMGIWERDVFLDNEPSKDSMLNELIRGLKIANKTGSVIMIGHVWSPSLAELLRELHPELARKGYLFSTISLQKNPT
jgi:polysaccharide deacetylase 2 family uncharacterized protein YibQ